MSAIKAYRNERNDLLIIDYDDDIPNDLDEYAGSIIESYIHVDTFSRHYNSITPTQFSSIEEVGDHLLGGDEDVFYDLQDTCQKERKTQKEFWDIFKAKAKENGYLVSPITKEEHTDVYYHQGLRFSWDSGVCGIAYIDLNDKGSENISEKDFSNALDHLLSVATDYHNGNLYCYTLETQDDMVYGNSFIGCFNLDDIILDGHLNNNNVIANDVLEIYNEEDEKLLWKETTLITKYQTFENL